MEPNDNQLGDIQVWMQQALVLSGQATSPDDTLRHIAASKTLSAPARLAIYQNGYYARLLQCLEGQFKALCHALGKELFDDFGRDYLRQYPSVSPTLALLGANFPDFLQQTRPDLNETEKEQWVEFMIALARFEWDLYSMFDAPGHEGKPYAALSDSDESLRVQPCFSLHQYGFPVSAYYRAVANGADPDVPAPGTQFVAMVRKNFRTAVYELLPPQYTFLQELASGCTVQEALAVAARVHNKPEAAAQAAWTTWRKTWIESGFFIINTQSA
ncbi:MAG: putative DNA-binding domain-containing protein [Saprospiraceae bacterium]|nr:putative DNA-binding domain-containing protein [Saprospiraceae bacterium]